jgi:hypothetical protein
MNTQSNFFKTSRTKFLLNDKDTRTNSVYDKPRVKTSSSPNRMPLIKEYNMKMKSSLYSNVPTVVTNYNIQNLKTMDQDKLQEELIKSKNELNKRNKDYHSLKISYLKLDSENKRNIKIIEEILEEASKQKSNPQNNKERKSEEDESELKNILANTHVSMSNVYKLKEVFYY